MTQGTDPLHPGEMPVRTVPLSDAHESVVPRHLPTVGLDELVSDAALMTRVDRKYLVSSAQAATVLGAVDLATRVLHIGGLRSFCYDSVYFDTPDYLSYLLTAQSRRHRFKLRTRHYVDTGAAYLELKVKDGRGRTVKTRIVHPAHQLTQLGTEAQQFLAPAFAERGFTPTLIARLQPKLRSEYARATLLQTDGSRATVDTALRWSNLEASSAAQLTDRVIIETKSGGSASPLDRALWRLGCRPSRISKFGVGTAALHPELPRNKWARTLNTHRFDALAAAHPTGAAHRDPLLSALSTREHEQTSPAHATLGATHA